jgi:hypothetical protein
MSGHEEGKKFVALRKAIDAGVNSGIAAPGVFVRIRKKHGLPHRENKA